MATKLDRLLASIDPKRVLDETYSRANRALNSISYSKSSIRDFEDFKTFIIESCSQIEAKVLSLSGTPTASRDFSWSRCVQFLQSVYGGNGEKAAFEMARTGCDGGLYAVLKAVALKIAENYSRNEISARVNHYWNGLSTAEKIAASAEYIEKYGHLLPGEMTEGSAARIRANFPRVLENHASMMQKMRGVGR